MQATGAAGDERGRERGHARVANVVLVERKLAEAGRAAAERAAERARAVVADRVVAQREHRERAEPAGRVEQRGERGAVDVRQPAHARAQRAGRVGAGERGAAR